MKKKIIYIFSIALFALSACNLDEDPKYTLNTMTVFSSSETTNAVIYRGYAHLADVEFFGRLLVGVTASNGTMVSTTAEDGQGRAGRYNVDPNDATWLLPVWRRVYKAVSEANYLIDGVGRSDLDATYKEQALGHAYFLRGYSYYLIGSLWGSAPLITSPVTSTTLHNGKSSRKEIYARAEEDLKEAASRLTTTEFIEGGGTATKYTAYAYLAKLYFMMASQVDGGLTGDALLPSDESGSTLWGKAKQYADSVVNSGLYALESDYATLFTSHLSGSKESIFQLNYTTGDGVQKRWNQMFGPANYVSGSPSFRSMRMDKAFFDYFVGTHDTVDTRLQSTYLMKFTNQNNQLQAGYPYMYAGNTYHNLRNYMKTGSDPKNPEYDFTSTTDTDNLAGAVMPVSLRNFWGKNIANAASGNNANPFNAKGADKNSVAQFDSRNTILFRYADLLLILADAENELGNLATAQSYVQQVLDRAQVKTTVPSTQADLRDFIFFERMFELAGEPVLYEDIRRRGTAYLQKVIEIHNNHWLTNYRVNLQTASGGVLQNFWDYLINDGNSSDADFLTKNLLLPIPKDELDNNLELSSSDQNFGY